MNLGKDLDSEFWCYLGVALKHGSGSSLKFSLRLALRRSLSRY